MAENKYQNPQFNECPDVYNEDDINHHQNIQRRGSGDFDDQNKGNKFPFNQRPFAFHDIQRQERHHQDHQNINNYQYPNPNMYPNNQQPPPPTNNYDYYGKNNNNNQMNPEYQDDPYNDPRYYNNNYNKNKEYKDPDVWDPAPPLKKNNKNISKPKNTPTNNQNKAPQKPTTNPTNNPKPSQNDKYFFCAKIFKN